MIDQRVYHSSKNQTQFRQRVEEAGLAFIDDDALKASLATFIKENNINKSLWIFGYGSLIWNPQLNYTNQQAITIKGLQRHFCIRSVIGYGTSECPGVMLAVEEKNQTTCTGIAYKIEKSDLQDVLYCYWQREMRVDVYTPKIVECTLDGKTAQLLTIVANEKSQLYMSELTLEQQARMIVAGKGILGDNVTYLKNLISHLEQRGIEDNYLSQLQRVVDRIPRVSKK